MSVYTSRARYVPVEKGFNIKRPPVEPQAFVAEKERAFAADMPTGLIPLDLSATLGTDYPATTPFMLTRYARVRAGETLACSFAASGEMWAVLRGSGQLRRGSERLDWSTGDMLALPGGVASAWVAHEDAVLWVTTDEPILAFEGVRPEAGDRAPIEATHYRCDAIARELRTLYERPMTPETHGHRPHREARHLPPVYDADAERRATRRGAASASAQRGSHRAGPSRGEVRIDDRRPDISLDRACDPAHAGRRRA